MNHLGCFEAGTRDTLSQSPAILVVAGARRFRALPSLSAERSDESPDATTSRCRDSTNTPTTPQQRGLHLRSNPKPTGSRIFHATCDAT